MKSCKPDRLQLTLNFEAGLSEVYGTCRELIASRVHQLGKLQKQIAADIDLSPSHLSRKLAQAPNDSMAFTLDNLEDYLQTQGDMQPVYYLVEKYLCNHTDEIEELEQRLAYLKQERKVNAIEPEQGAA